MTGSVTPYALGESLPGLFQEDWLLQQLCAAIDSTLAPVISTLDCLPAYLDPQTTPEDMVDWLAGWVGITFDAGIELPERRRMIKAAVSLHSRRGTAEGIAAGVRMWFGVEPEIRDSGAMGWSPDPDAPLPGSPTAQLMVRLAVADPSSVDLRTLDAVVTALKPAHVPHVAEVVARQAG